ncbi:hypothetical protein, partial [Escherichia coli]|uniref:hypothetical protein n=1 Tax=Escherichia coli TaxID=562 RepID=UPI001F3E540E
GVSNVNRINYYLFTSNTITNKDIQYSLHWIGYKVGIGDATKLNKAYSALGATSDLVMNTAQRMPYLLEHNGVDNY